MVATDTNVKLVFESHGPQLGSFREALGKYAGGLTTAIFRNEDVPFKDKLFGDGDPVSLGHMIGQVRDGGVTIVSPERVRAAAPG